MNFKQGSLTMTQRPSLFIPFLFVTSFSLKLSATLHCFGFFISNVLFCESASLTLSFCLLAARYPWGSSQCLFPSALSWVFTISLNGSRRWLSGLFLPSLHIVSLVLCHLFLSRQIFLYFLSTLMNLLGGVSQDNSCHDSFLQLFEVLSCRTVLAHRNILWTTYLIENFPLATLKKKEKTGEINLIYFIELSLSKVLFWHTVSIKHQWNSWHSFFS